MSGKATLVITRLYQQPAETDFCAEAVRRLLNLKERKQTGASTSAPNAARKGK